MQLLSAKLYNKRSCKKTEKAEKEIKWQSVHRYSEEQKGEKCLICNLAITQNSTLLKALPFTGVIFLLIAYTTDFVPRHTATVTGGGNCADLSGVLVIKVFSFRSEKKQTVSSSSSSWTRGQQVQKGQNEKCSLGPRVGEEKQQQQQVISKRCLKSMWKRSTL